MITILHSFHVFILLSFYAESGPILSAGSAMEVRPVSLRLLLLILCLQQLKQNMDHYLDREYQIAKTRSVTADNSQCLGDVGSPSVVTRYRYVKTIWKWISCSRDKQVFFLESKLASLLSNFRLNHIHP